MSKRPWHTVLFLMVIFLAITTDQITKALAKEYLPRGEIIPIVGDVFVFMYAENEGAFLGLGSSLPSPIRTWVLVIFPTLLLVVFIGGLFFREKNPTLLHILTMASIVGGGMSNLFDRMIYNGRVIDFMNFGIGPIFRTGILNVADLWITFGAIVLIIWGGRDKRIIPSQKDHEDGE
ncbi:MAG: signal peptidase II [Brevinematales bacterium]